MEPREYRLHKGARVALYIAGALCILLVFAAPFGIWILLRTASGKLSISGQGLVAKALTSVRFDFLDVARIGICRVPIHAKGIGGALARQKVGGDHGINVCVILQNKKKKQFTVSMYEDHEAALAQITKAVNKPYEELSMGAFGVKWPDTQNA